MKRLVGGVVTGVRKCAPHLIKTIVALALAAALLPFVSPAPAYAKTMNLYPNAAGDLTGLTRYPNAGEANWQDVDEVTADDDTTYVYAGATVASDLYNLQDSAVSFGTINSVTVYIRARSNAGGTSNAYTYIKTNNQPYPGTTNAATSQTVWNNASQVYTTNPQTGFAWTWAEVNALQIGASARRANVTQVYAVVDYAFIESYREEAHSNVWGEALTPYDSTYSTVWSGGTGMAPSQVYNVGYYDNGASNNLVLTHSVTSGADGSLSSWCVLSNYPTSSAGTWYAVVFKDPATPPSTYSTTGATAEDSFAVDNSAIPEFPTVIAGIAVAGMCFGIYWLMRKKAKFKMRNAS